MSEQRTVECENDCDVCAGARAGTCISTGRVCEISGRTAVIIERESVMSESQRVSTITEITPEQMQRMRRALSSIRFGGLCVDVAAAKTPEQLVEALEALVAANANGVDHMLGELAQLQRQLLQLERDVEGVRRIFGLQS